MVEPRRYRHSRGLKPHPAHKYMVPDVVEMVAVEDVRAAIDELRSALVEPKPLGSDHDVGHHRGWLAALAAVDGRLSLNTNGGEG
jgi:hypothetical protein